MSKSPLSLLSAALVAASCFVPGAAHAGAARTTFVVSAHVVDTCAIAIDGHASRAGSAGVSTACSSGAGTVGTDGIASASGKAPTRVTRAREKRVAGGEWMVVTVSF
jgi:hypothetical protein